jgi:hypothetical protein
VLWDENVVIRDYKASNCLLLYAETNIQFRKPRSSSPAEYLLLKEDPTLCVGVFERSVANFGSLYIKSEWCKRETVFRTWNEHGRLGNVCVCVWERERVYVCVRMCVCVCDCKDLNKYFNKIPSSRTHHAFKNPSLQRSKDWKHSKKCVSLDSLRGSSYSLRHHAQAAYVVLFGCCWHSVWDKKKLWSAFGKFGNKEKAIMFQRCELPSGR